MRDYNVTRHWVSLIQICGNGIAPRLVYLHRELGHIAFIHLPLVYNTENMTNQPVHGRSPTCVCSALRTTSSKMAAILARMRVWKAGGWTTETERATVNKHNKKQQQLEFLVIRFFSP